MPFLPPNQQCQSTEGKKIKRHTGLLSTLSCAAVDEILTDITRRLLSVRTVPTTAEGTPFFGKHEHGAL